MSALILRPLQLADEASLRVALDEFSASDPDWEFAFHFDRAAPFAAYVARLERWPDGLDLPEGWVPNTFLVACLGERIVGRVSLRHQLDDFLREVGGHIGFGVVASARRRGHGTEILRLTLPLARARGLERVLITCDEDNAGSRAIIESCGGVLEDLRTRDDGGLTRRYWIEL